METTTTRPLSPGDAPAMTVLSCALDRRWWGQAETEFDEVEQRLRLAGNLDERSRGIETSAGLVAYGLQFGSHDIDVVIAPELDADTRRAVEDELFGWLTAVGVGRIEAPEQDTDLLATYARHGFVPISSSFELERPAERPLAGTPPLPEGVELRPFDRDADASAVHALIYSFWTEVPTHADRDLEEWRELFLGHASYDGDHQVIAWRGGAPVGAAICRIFGGDTGWVTQLGVAHGERGCGLGRALLTEATRRLADTQGVEVIGLSVVARNEQALGLYRSAGFEVTREWVTCAPG